jgi:hypothetical protein
MKLSFEDILSKELLKCKTRIFTHQDMETNTLERFATDSDNSLLVH